jgi:hypothetical protein
MEQPSKMEATRCEQLIRRRAVAKGMLTCMQAFIEAGNHNVNQIQVRFNKLPGILRMKPSVPGSNPETDLPDV